MGWVVGGRIARWRGCWSIEWLGGGVSSFTVWRLFFFFFDDELGTGTEVTSMYRFVVVRGLLILNLLPHLFLGVFPPPLFSFLCRTAHLRISSLLALLVALGTFIAKQMATDGMI